MLNPKEFLSSTNSASVRDDHVPKEPYLSPNYVRLESTRLWPRVWQIACREEELPDVGSFVTYEIARESIIVVRTKEGIRAYYNVCQHRGRRLLEGHGQVATIYCRFHGWSWNLEGKNIHILDPQDWSGRLCKDDVSLKSPLVDTWGGFVWINMDPQAESLRHYMSPAIDFLEPYDFAAMRFRWYKTFVLKCNWKVAVEAFNEGYHVAATHPQLLPYFDDVTTSAVHGKHSMFHYNDARAMGQPSARLSDPLRDDTRQPLHDYVTMMGRELNAIISDNMSNMAAKRLLTDLPEGTKDYDTLAALMRFTFEASHASGAGWPDISVQQVAAAGTDWHLFPNAVTLMFPDGALWYRARPHGEDPDSCIFDVWSLQRFPPGEEPQLERKFYHDWRQAAGLGQILTQDFSNMESVQQGMHSRGFVAARTNPKQERPVSNYHRVLHEYLSKGE